jgi:hypothetical protein
VATRMSSISGFSRYTLERWSPSEKARTAPFTEADRTTTRRQFWLSHSPSKTRRLGVSGASNTNSRWLPNSIPRGRQLPEGVVSVGIGNRPRGAAA